MVPYKTCFELYDEVKGGKVNGREYVVVPEKESLIDAVSEEIKTLGINSEPISRSIGSVFELSLTKLFVCVAISVLWGVICVHAQAKKASRLNPVEALFFVE